MHFEREPPNIILIKYQQFCLDNLGPVLIDEDVKDNCMKDDTRDKNFNEEIEGDGDMVTKIK